MPQPPFSRIPLAYKGFPLGPSAALPDGVLGRTMRRELKVFNAADYGARGDGYTNDTRPLQEAIDAASDHGHGIVFLPAGTYSAELLSTPNDAAKQVWIVGAGIDATSIVGRTGADNVLTLGCNGGLIDVTVDGNAATVNGLVVTLPNGGAAIDRVDIVRTKIRNTATGSAGWVFVAWDQGSNYDISELHLTDVILEGPSSHSQDAMATTYVDTVYVTNLTMRDLYRSPNFYVARRLIVNGMLVANVANTYGFVVDSGVDAAELSNVHVKSDCTTVALMPTAVDLANCRFDVATQLGGGTPTPTVKATTSSFQQVYLLGDGVARLLMSACDLIAASGQGACLWDARTAATTSNNILCDNCYFDGTSAVGTRWLGSANGTTWANTSFTGGRTVTNVIYNLTLASTVRIAGVRGYNPQGTAAITVGSSPYTYTAGATPEAVYIRGGTVSDISKDSRTIFAATPATVWLEPGESVVVTYTVAPTMEKDRK